MSTGTRTSHRTPHTSERFVVDAETQSRRRLSVCVSEVLGVDVLVPVGQPSSAIINETVQ